VSAKLPKIVKNTSPKVLIILAHPDVDNGSLANKIITESVKTIKEVEVRDITKLYPSFNIDVQAEQNALMAADVVIFQYPFHWYSIPGILKEWLDKVFLYGFAYGSEGNKLKGKEFVISTTVGGPEDSYQASGHNSFTMNEFFKPLQQTIKLAGMTFNTPLVSHDMVYIPGVDNNLKKTELEKRAKAHGDKLSFFIHQILSNNAYQIS